MLDMGAIGIGRIFSHNSSKGNPPHVPEDFESESIEADKEKRLRSALEAILWCLEWESFLPLELQMMEFVKKRFFFMEHFREVYIQELNELGIA
jgi:hypothetical protein